MEVGERKSLSLTNSGNGDEVSYTHDADGRLLSRTVRNQAGDFLSAQGFVWNGWELVTQVGLNFQDEPIWQIEHLPGPMGLDDSPQLRVTTGLIGGTPQTRIFDLVRDEMGTVVGILEGDGADLQLRARVLYDPYGQAHVEVGPELRSVEHDPELTFVDGTPQSNLAAGPAENPVLGIAGSAVVSTSMALDPGTIGDGLRFEWWDGDVGAWVELGPSEIVIALNDEDAMQIQVMPVAGWLEGESYRIVLTVGLSDIYGRTFVLPDGGLEYKIVVGIPTEVASTGDPLPALPRLIPVIFDNVEAASETLDCDGDPCFPGGLNLLFQGLWTDPVTGISYARNRWYDARTASWLSEDPMGDVDSPNLYAGFGLMPHAMTDPMGEAIRIHMFTKNSNLSERQQQRLAELIVRYFKSLPWAGEADVTIGIVPRSFEDYESWKGPFAWRRQRYEELAPRAMEISRPKGLAHAAQYFMYHPELVTSNRLRSEERGFEFHTYIEVAAPSSAIGRTVNADSGERHAGGVSSDGRSIALEQSFSELVEQDAYSDLLDRHGDFLNLLLSSFVAAHELGHQFGLSPLDASPFLAGRGVMSTRNTTPGYLVRFLNSVNELAEDRGGIENVTEGELEELWFKVFEFEGDDARWILNLADPEFK